MTQKWRLVPAFAFDGAIATAGHATADSARAAARSPRTAAAPSPNQVIVWNRILLGILLAPDVTPPTVHPTHSLAMMHLAVADAVGAIARRYEPYALAIPAPPQASQAAAAAQAAHDVLVALYPRLTPSLDANLAASLHALTDEDAASAGVSIGTRAAEAILARRTERGSPGSPPPFVLRAADQFGPTGMGSPDEMRSRRRDTSLTRTSTQMRLAVSWSAPIEVFWNEIAQSASLRRGDSTSTDARLFAVLNATLADGIIAFVDGSPGGARDPDADSVISHGATEVLSNQFGRWMRLEVTSPALPGAERRFTSFAAVAREIGLSRIYAGDHLQLDHAGARLGRRVGRFVLHHALVLRPDGRY